MLKLAAGILLLLVVGMFSTYWFACPCGYVPGGPLSGPTNTNEVSDWSFVNDREAVPLCQVEVDAGLPYTVNVNCMSSEEKLYVSCSKCEGKFWSSRAIENPVGYVMAGGKVYAINFSRITDEAELSRIWSVRANKVAGGDAGVRPNHWWSFQLTSR